MNASIVVSTFGTDYWKILAAKRALPSARSFGLPVYYNHGESLCKARNKGLYEVKTEFIVYCDADDELAPGFFDEMDKVDGDLRPPSVEHVYEKVTFMPRVVGQNGVHNHVCVGECLLDGNWMVVGTVARTELLKEVGGWKEWETFEDWELWLRCWLAGATITPVPKAIYRAYSTAQGRCKNLPQEEIDKVCLEIKKANLPHLYK